MTSLSPDDFDRFFCEVNRGHQPFRWQRRLLQYLLENGEWPPHIGAPTGSGKSNVVDVHVFANALAGADSAPRLPRRLAVAVNRRALVDSHFYRALRIQNLLEEAKGGVLLQVRDSLRRLQVERTWASGTPPTMEQESALKVVELRGGMAPERGWVDDPCSCTVIAGTPDMLGSRLLMRGYGSRRYAWPREAGLLAYDTALVVDEAHLNRQLVLTARRIAGLEQVATDRIGVPVLQVVDTTATPADGPSGQIVGVRPDDLAPGHDDMLAMRLTRPKPASLSESPAWPSKGPAAAAHIDHLVSRVRDLLGRRVGDARPVGCIVNRVDTAVRVTEALVKAGIRASAWVGRRRPADIAQMIADNPSLFSGSESADSNLDVLVATQAVEVGVDLDLFGLVTELASASALAQRAGRVNRIGLSESADIVVIVPADPGKIADYLPYREDDLKAGYDWVARLASRPGGLSPWAIAADAPQPESPRRVLFQRPELYDAIWWSHTSEDLFAPTDLSLFLQDDLDPGQATAGLVFRDFTAEGGLGDDSRDGGGDDGAMLLSLLNATPPTQFETFAVPLADLREIAELALANGAAAPFRFRDGEVTVLVGKGDLRPGDVLIVSRSLRCLRSGVPVGDGATELVECAYWGDVGVRLGDASLRAALAGQSAEDAQETYRGLCGNDGEQVVLPPGAEDLEVLPWVVITPAVVAASDVEQLQVFSARLGIPLPQHAANVETRCAGIARAVGVPEGLIETIQRAGLMHDEGKRDARFQRLLGAGRSTGILAKSVRRSAQQARRDTAAAGLRTGWRHEQLSAAIVAGVGDRSPTRDLVVRLVGTSHGRGRGGFDHPPSELSGHQIGPEAEAAAERLFGNAGGWETLIESTHKRWGIWGCAYLEALLRAADCQISREGS